MSEWKDKLSVVAIDEVHCISEWLVGGLLVM